MGNPPFWRPTISGDHPQSDGLHYIPNLGNSYSLLEFPETFGMLGPKSPRNPCKVGTELFAQWDRSNLVDLGYWPKIGFLNRGFGSISVDKS